RRQSSQPEERDVNSSVIIRVIRGFSSDPSEEFMPLSDEPRHPWFEPAQAILAGILLLEIAVFSVIGTNFLTLANAFEVLRLSVEGGLRAVAVTPVTTRGGIDLSVGSRRGLWAVVFGMLWRAAGLPIVAAAALTLVLGALAGSVKGLLITMGRIPPLIVTL